MSSIKANLIDFGILEPQKEALEKVSDSAATTGYTLTADQMQVKAHTDSIPARPGIAFGIKYEIEGDQADGEVAYQRRIIHPAIQNPAGEIRTERVDIRGEKPGSTTFDFFRFDKEYEMQLGNWTFQLLDGPDVLLEKTFHVE